ncbi:hypothetical protein Hanom_Chr15g01393681 [Helianthus anomalus]
MGGILHQEAIFCHIVCAKWHATNRWSLDSTYSPHRIQERLGILIRLLANASLVGNLIFSALHATIPTFFGVQLFHMNTRFGLDLLNELRNFLILETENNLKDPGPRQAYPAPRRQKWHLRGLICPGVRDSPGRSIWAEPNPTRSEAQIHLGLSYQPHYTFWISLEKINEGTLSLEEFHPSNHPTKKKCPNHLPSPSSSFSSNLSRA